MGNDVFPDPNVEDESLAKKYHLRRQCRGLIFNHDGDVISPGFHKFFNCGERTETLIENINWNLPHVILEKLDGSLIRPVPVPSDTNSYDFRLGTKMGIGTDVACHAENWLKSRPNYVSFIRHCIGNKITPLFEFCSLKTQIVLGYHVDRLVLTGVRSNLTGEYHSFDDLKAYADFYNLDLVKTYPGTVSSMEELVAATKSIIGEEGFVVAWDYDRVKIKSDWYVTIHKAKENILRESGVINLFLEEKADDIKAFLVKEDRLRLEQYETDFWNGIKTTVHSWSAQCSELRTKYANDRRSFAINETSLDKNFRSMMFKSWDNPDFDWTEAVLECVRRSLSTMTKVDENRSLWGNAQWISKDVE